MANSPKPPQPCQSDPRETIVDKNPRERSNGSPPPVETVPTMVDPHKVNAGEDDEMSVQGFVPSRFRFCLALVAIVLTGGLMALVFYWKKAWMLRCTHTRTSLARARKVMLRDVWGQEYVQTVRLVNNEGAHLNKSEEKTYYSRNVVETHLMAPSPSHSRPGSPTASPSRSTVAAHRYFVNKKIKYIWSSESECFFKLSGLEKGQSAKSLHHTEGLSALESSLRRVLYGGNKIVIRVTPLVTLFLTEAINPFYVFQIFSMALWYADEYEFYASCIVVISIVSLSFEVYAIRGMQKKLRERVNISGTVTVCRGSSPSTGQLIFEDIDFDDLVPGDVMEIPRHGCQILVDAVLISGNCIVNEAMLTGESAPVTKTPLPSSPGLTYSIQDHSRHTLFCGTEVVQTRFYGNQRVLAVVVRTGFSTSKGELVRSILYPKPVDFKFNKDAGMFLLVLAGIAIVGFIFTIVIMVERHNPIGKIFLRSLDLITIVVPPALPAAMTVGIIHAQSRLKKSSIFCISPKLINVCGGINTVCFDKTGTLTEDGLDLRCVLPVDDRARIFLASVAAVRRVIPLPPSNAILSAMATCHSLTVIDGKLVGDPLDIRMFEGTDWSLEEPEVEDTAKFDIIMPTVVRSPTGDDEIGILRQFPFSSSLQRMSVITKAITSAGPQPGFHLYCKGSPEMIVSLSNSTTVPSNFQEVLTQYTQQGFRVLALAHRPLAKLSYVKAQRVQREALETNLQFLGLLVLENRLKSASFQAIVSLREARIRPVMVTGDNMLTALSVARECGMIERHEDCLIVNAFKAPDGRVDVEYLLGAKPDENMAARMAESSVSTQESAEEGVVSREANRKFHFALMGKCFALIRHHRPEILKRLVVRGTVFARMAPDQKQQLVEELQALGYYVGMCGDGANDCGALRTAHAGVSLSDTEASIASPFTSKVADVSCVPTVIREGRAALVTSFGIFKYMAAYSLIQFVTVLVLYWIECNLTDVEFLYIDLYLLTVLSIFYGYTPAYSSLAPIPPTSSLISAKPILSLLAQVSVALCFQVYVYFDVQRQSWFSPFVPNEEEHMWGYENSVLFYVSVFQYITAAVAFSKGAPYRKSIFSNYLFLMALVILTASSIGILLYPPQALADWMELRTFPEFFYSLKIFGLVSLYFFISLFVEMIIVDSNACLTLCRRDEDECLPAKFSAKQQHQYRSVEKEIEEEPSWPPISKSSTSIDFSIISEGVSGASPTRASMFGRHRRSTGKRPDSEMSVGSDAFSDLGTSPGPSPPPTASKEFFAQNEAGSAAITLDDTAIDLLKPSGFDPSAFRSLPATPAPHAPSAASAPALDANEPLVVISSEIQPPPSPSVTNSLLPPTIRVTQATPTSPGAKIHSIPQLPGPPYFSSRRGSNAGSTSLPTQPADPTGRDDLLE